MHRSLAKSRQRLAFLLMIPAAAVLGAVLIYPLGFGFYLSLTNMSMRNFLSYKLVGVLNYADIFLKKAFYVLFARTIVWTVVNVFLHVTLGLWLAILLNRRLPGKAVFRVLLILPWAVPEYITALTWKGLLNYQYGAINIALTKLVGGSVAFLRTVGLPVSTSFNGIPWLSDPLWAFAGVILANVWLGIPFMMIVSLGGLQSIPHELYESADIDGASGWAKFSAITLPLLRSVLVPAVVLGTIWTFNKISVIFLITQGGPGERTHTMITSVYRAAFDYYRYGYAAAFSAVIFFILLVFTLNFINYLRGTEAVY